MTNPYRLENVGFINRDKKISFKFNGKEYFGFKGDTLASALLSNGIHLVGRSFKYHRPRGFFGAGVDEPNAKLQVDLIIIYFLNFHGFLQFFPLFLILFLTPLLVRV